MKKICGSNQSGRSMIEMLGVLAIIGVLSVGGISGYSKAMAKYKTNKTLDQLSMLILNIRTLYANQTSYAGLSNGTAIGFELVTQEMASGSTVGEVAADDAKLYSPFGGEVVIAAGNPDTTTFTVEYQGLDRQSCVAIATSDWGGSASSGLVSIKVGAETYQWSDNSLPVTVAAASDACVTDGGTTITWTYN